MTSTQTTARKNMYRRFRNLSDHEAARVLEFMDALAEGDDEPLTEEEESAIDEYLREKEAGTLVLYSLTEVKARLGIGR